MSKKEEKKKIVKIIIQEKELTREKTHIRERRK